MLKGKKSSEDSCGSLPTISLTTMFYLSSESLYYVFRNSFDLFIPCSALFLPSIFFDISSITFFCQESFSSVSLSDCLRPRRPIIIIYSTKVYSVASLVHLVLFFIVYFKRAYVLKIRVRIYSLFEPTKVAVIASHKLTYYLYSGKF